MAKKEEIKVPPLEVPKEEASEIVEQEEKTTKNEVVEEEKTLTIKVIQPIMMYEDMSTYSTDDKGRIEYSPETILEKVNFKFLKRIKKFPDYIEILEREQ